MEIKIFFVLAFICNLYLSTLATISNKNVTIIDGTSSNHTITHVVGNTPIVIHTQLQHYDQPTLREYQECHENLEKCKKVCEGVENPVTCVKECPVCPILIKEKIVVQGINDTDINSLPTTPLNTTNIIRLTNQIQNIIETHRGNISYNNDNNVHIHQNISRVGGKFGLGYNNTDPCCIVVRSSSNCLRNKFSTANRCPHKRHRVCSKHCKSRVMMAKRVTLCEKSVPIGANNDHNEEICNETVQYVPYRSHKKSIFRSRQRCSAIPTWPYVLCGQHDGSYEYSVCELCQRLTYYYILQRGIPTQCRQCFMDNLRPRFEMYPTPWYPVMTSYPVYNDFNFEDDFHFELNGWHQDKTKCWLPDGTISENCQDLEGSGSESPPISSNPWENLPEAQDEYIEYDNNDENDFDELRRRRRHTFTRSKYSHRYNH